MSLKRRMWLFTTILLIVKKVKEGKKVIRLKNGDSSIFSWCSQELEAVVKNNIEFEIVPGVTAASSASCLTGIPLTDRRYASNWVFVSGHEDPNKANRLVNWSQVARSGTVILYMAVEKLTNIVSSYLKLRCKPSGTKVLTGFLKNIAAKAKRNKIKPPDYSDYWRGETNGFFYRVIQGKIFYKPEN